LFECPELVNLCVKEEAIFPSLDAFMMGIKCPPIYLIFYEYFYRSSIGDTPWKLSCNNTSDITAPLNTLQLEAFSFLFLKNNYFAWLLQAKRKLIKSKKKLVTDYDPFDQRKNKKNLHELVWKKVEINLYDLDEGTIFEATEGNRKKLLLSPEEPRDLLYTVVQDQYSSKLDEIRMDVQGDSMYQKIEHLMQDLAKDKDADKDLEKQIKEAQTPELKQKLKERRDILRSLRVYTNVLNEHQDEQSKGWSMAKSSEDLCRFVEMLEQDGEKAKQFRAAYRLIHMLKMNEGSVSKKRKSAPPPVPVNYKTKIWKMEEVEIVEL